MIAACGAEVPPEAELPAEVEQRSGELPDVDGWEVVPCDIGVYSGPNVLLYARPDPGSEVRACGKFTHRDYELVSFDPSCEPPLYATDGPAEGLVVCWQFQYVDWSDPEVENYPEMQGWAWVLQKVTRTRSRGGR